MLEEGTVRHLMHGQLFQPSPEMFESMLKMRMWDRKNIALQRTGRMYTYAPIEGQEAISAGLVQGADASDCHALLLSCDGP